MLLAATIYPPIISREEGLVKVATKRKRGNGEGSVYKLPDGRWKAVYIVGTYTDDKGKLHRKTRTAVKEKKKDALDALTELKKPVAEKRAAVTLKELYDKWEPTHQAKQAVAVYHSAFQHLKPLWAVPVADIDVDDLQACLDNCNRSKQTKSNMKTLCGLLYQYGVPRHLIPNNINLASFLKVSGAQREHRVGFKLDELDKIKKAVDVVSYADYIYCLCYLGFRLSEFLSLTIDQYNRDGRYFIGGSKTESGRDRIVTISPKIQPIIDRLTDEKQSGYIFCDDAGNRFTDDRFTQRIFYDALSKIGIDNPVITSASGRKRHKYSPHSCRHTFATLMKRVQAPTIDKQSLIGHSSEEMLKYYQDAPIEDLRRITDLI